MKPVTIKIKRNDKGRILTDTLLMNDVPINLSSATVVFVMKDQNSGAFIRVNADIDANPVTGKVSVTLELAQTSVAAHWQFEWEITFGTGDVITIPPDTYHILEILEDLG